MLLGYGIRHSLDCDTNYDSCSVLLADLIHRSEHQRDMSAYVAYLVYIVRNEFSDRYHDILHPSPFGIKATTA